MKFKFNSLERTGLVLFFVCAILAGCASIPSQFADETLSQNDQNIVIACATVRQDMPTAELGIETATPLALSYFCKVPATTQRIGNFINVIGLSLETTTGTTTIGANYITQAASDLNTSVADSALIGQVVAAADSALNAQLTQLETYAATATNPDVKAYALGTIPIVLSDLGTALVYSTEPYATASATPATATAMLKERRLYFAQVRAHAKATMLSLVNCPDLTTLYLRKFARD